MENKEFELYDYIIKFLDEHVHVYNADMSYSIHGTGIAVEFDCNIDNDHANIIIKSDDNSTYTYDIWEYNYKMQSWYDGNMKTQLYIKSE